ncbi:MAG TPA: hypothetical protein VHM00_15195 [Caldimonas sp.]|jgi:hypothetical protein|nr:hypothetical protein [Caldimonas sp.]HEX2542415.1 hypothetical protein [Caldimonas sp.]
MNVKKLAFAAVALAGTLGVGLAEARGRDDIQWSVTIGAPAPVYFGAPAPVYYGAPVHVYERGYHRGHRRGAYGDADRDGIPNRFDRVYNPRWDRDGDGIPNRYDRRDNSRHHHGWRGRDHNGWHGR